MSIVLTREQVRRVDQLAIERYGLSGLVMMENAGRNAAEIIYREFRPTGAALICCGTGNNGGDGCVIARHLHNAGWSVRVALAGEEARLSADARANYAIVKAMGLGWPPEPSANSASSPAAAIHEDDVVVDALLGTGFTGELRAPLAELVDAINRAEKRAVVAVDIPTGLHCDSGTPARSTIRADLTITFVATKPGFSEASAAHFVGRVIVADIGVPRELVTGIHGGVS